MKIFFIALLTIIGVLFAGFVRQALWHWFVPLAFPMLPNTISIWLAIGLGYIGHIFFGSHSTLIALLKLNKDQYLELVYESIGYSSSYLFLGWLVHLIIQYNLFM